MTEKQKRKGWGERDKQNRHAYDKVTAGGKGETNYSSSKKSSRQAMPQLSKNV